MECRVTRYFFAMSLALGLLSAAHAHPVLTFVEQTVTQPAKGSKDKPASDEFPVTATFGHNYLSVDSKDARQLFDFEHRRVYHLDLENKTFEDFALFSVLGFRAMELQNRISINTMLSAAKIENGAQAPALSEHLLSLTADGQDTVIDIKHAKGMTAYSWKGTELLSVSDKTRALPPAYQAEYPRFLRYVFGGHPKILSDLEHRSGVPEILKTTQHDLGERFITLRLTSITNAPDAPYSLAGFTRAAPSREPFLTLQKIGPDGAAGLAKRAEAAQRDRDAATAQGRMLDAALAHFTYALSTGDSGRDWLMQTRDRIKGDADASALASSLSAKNADETGKAVQTLAALRAKSTSPYAYLLDVFAANHEVALKHATEARKLFLSALAANPYLTGAWFDLGKLFYGTFKTEEAWACWDAARAMNPNHPFGKNVESMERQMAADHPELF